jgi:hypothetical protein
MPRANEAWTTITLNPLVGPLDTRSRPADVTPGGYRWKQNLGVSPDAKLSRRAGHARFWSDATSYTNYDYHHQGRTPREPVTFQFESTSSDGTRRYLLGTQSSVSVLNPTTGLYTDLVLSKGAAGSVWKAAELKDHIIFTNDVDPPWAYRYNEDAPLMVLDPIPDLYLTLKVRKARVVVQYKGFIMLMNVEENGERHANRIFWSDLNLPLDYDTSDDENLLSGFADLDPNEIILASGEMGGRLYIYTNRSIWWATTTGESTNVFVFVRAYTEPKNQTGCIAYENTLVSVGTEHWYMGREGIYRFNPYVPAPICDDWLYRAAGVIYTDPTSKIDPAYCKSPVAEYVPERRELFISWPSEGQEGINNWTLAAQVVLQTADVIDHGYTSLVNFRRQATDTQGCNETQELLGASGSDWCIKSIGNVFYREQAVSIDQTTDIPDVAAYTKNGYTSILRGMIPLGLMEREKTLRSVLLDHDTRVQTDPCIARLRIGNHRLLVDANSTDTTCSPQWRTVGDDKSLECPDSQTIAEMTAKNLRPDNATVWACYDQGRFLWFELSILNADGTPAIGGDSAFHRIEFEVQGAPKPAP